MNKTPFFLACEEGHKDVVKSLMNNNCNMVIRDKIGRSALHAVCTKRSLFGCGGGRLHIAELLINIRCGVYGLDDAGQSALHGACKQGNPGLLNFYSKMNVTLISVTKWVNLQYLMLVEYIVAVLLSCLSNGIVM